MIARAAAVVAVSVGLSSVSALAQFDSGSDGSDGAFHPLASVTIDLALATTATWNTPSPMPGRGVYDPDKWAVVFKYTTIDVPAGVTVTFSNHPSGAPVVWLASADVTIEGTVSVNGENGALWLSMPPFSIPGPGGFGGGRADPNPGQNSGGFGPGAFSYSEHGYYAVGNPPLHYGNEAVVPLIGGSGGAGGISDGGGAGGGAILVAATGNILIEGQILALGGSGSYAGSGGAIRLISDEVAGAGMLRATGSSATNYGRIRIEAETIALSDGGIPPWTSSTPGPVFPPPGSPTLRVVSVDAIPVPADPLASILTPDVAIASDLPVTLHIEATNIPAGTTVLVYIVPEHGTGVRNNSTPLMHVGGGLLAATYTTTLPHGKCEIQLRANWTP